MISTRPRVLTAALALVALAAAPLAADEQLTRKVESSAHVFEALLEAPDRGVPERLLEHSNCVAIIPDVVKGAFGWGGRIGKGVMSCRTDKVWSPPIFVKIWGGSFGLQIGAEVTDLVLFFMTEKSARSLLKSRFTLGGDASVAAGPVGRTAQASTDAHFKAEIYTYAKSRGLFAGLSLEGARIAPHQKSINRFYGERLWPEDVLFERRASRVPAEAQGLIEVLP